MMREILGVAQDDPQIRRRWFHDEYFDLFVWQSGDEIAAFELCYGIDSSERALVWRRDGGFFHDGVKAGTPVPDRILGTRLESGGTLQADPIVSRFEFAARAFPQDIRLIVTARIREYAERMPAFLARRRRVRRADWQQQIPEPR